MHSRSARDATRRKSESTHAKIGQRNRASENRGRRRGARSAQQPVAHAPAARERRQELLDAQPVGNGDDDGRGRARFTTRTGQRDRFRPRRSMRSRSSPRPLRRTRRGCAAHPAPPTLRTRTPRRQQPRSPRAICRGEPHRAAAKFVGRSLGHDEGFDDFRTTVGNGLAPGTEIAKAAGIAVAGALAVSATGRARRDGDQQRQRADIAPPTEHRRSMTEANRSRLVSGAPHTDRTARKTSHNARSAPEQRTVRHRPRSASDRRNRQDPPLPRLRQTRHPEPKHTGCRAHRTRRITAPCLKWVSHDTRPTREALSPMCRTVTPRERPCPAIGDTPGASFGDARYGTPPRAFCAARALAISRQSGHSVRDRGRPDGSRSTARCTLWRESADEWSPTAWECDCHEDR